MSAVQTFLPPERSGGESDLAQQATGQVTGQTAGACERVIQRFGGVRPMASKLEIPVTTVQGWKRRGAIPTTRGDDLRAAARSHGIPLDENELLAATRGDERGPEAGDAGATPDPFSPSTVTSSPITSSPPPRLFEQSPSSRTPSSFPPSARVSMAALPRLPMGYSFGPVRLAVAAAGIAVLAAVVAVTGLGEGTSPNGTSAPSAALERRVTDLEGRVARAVLDQSATASALEKSTLELGSRVASVEMGLPALERKIAAHGMGSPALGSLLAATQLRNALATAGPFQNELSALRLANLGAGNPAFRQDLDQIANRSGTGIATESWLVGRFALVSADIVRAANYNSMFGRMADGLYDVLSWVPPLYRLAGAEDGSSPRAVAERAQAWMAMGNFSRAVALLDELNGLPAEAAAPWLSEAHARITADRVRTQVSRLADALTTSASSTSGK